MSDIVIHARDLRKVYRLYAGPGFRFLDMFGMLGNRPGAYTEHAALDGVTLDIHRGEKVAFIGRNGAGKSTLLKLFTRVIEPTSGTLDVKGKAHALLQIGSGFHPDFTGRENVYAYLAQLGIAGREADRRYAEILEFAELEEYINQPVKTYSSGMAVRLMFSTSTAITPDLLVLDEVLGVGDAYFAAKSYQRIRELCERDGTTLLLVTHDIYSAISLCERLVWIDRGRVLMDDAGPVVVKAYEDSVRQQEENRLRLKIEERARSGSGSTRGNPQLEPLLFEIYAKENQPQPCPVYFSRIELFSGDQSLGKLSLAMDAFDGDSVGNLQREGTCWGDEVEWQGRIARPLLNYGSPFHKVAGLFQLKTGQSLLSAMRIELDYWSDQPCQLAARWFPAGREELLGPLPAGDQRWLTFRLSTQPAGDADFGSDRINASGRQGTGDIAVVDVRVIDGAGHERLQFQHGEHFEVLVGFEIRRAGLRERAQVMVSFHHEGLHVLCRTVCRDLMFDAEQQRTGVVRMVLDPFPLPVGNFSITVMVTSEGYFDRPQAVFYSLNPGVYASLSRIVDIVVKSQAPIASGGVVCAAAWELLDTRPT